MSSTTANIARHLREVAETQPDAAALKFPAGRHPGGRINYLTLSFAELTSEVAAWQSRFAQQGIRRGDRVLVMVRPGLPLIAAAFALFASAAVPVVIDPGMGLASFLKCVERSRPRALVGIPLARLVSRLFRRPFRSVEVRVAAASRGTARQARVGDQSVFSLAPTAGPELAAILFTSGSTGAPKGVCYAHEMFEAQVRLIQSTYGIQPGEVDLPMLPVFALFNPALGMTTVVPEIDPGRPAAVDPAKIVQAIQQEQVTNSFGSPTLWRKIAAHCESQEITLPSIRRILSAGAPVPPDLWTRLPRLIPNGELHSPYGATEALPVASISATEMQAGPAAAALCGAGTCVGSILPANTVRIIPLREGAIENVEQARALTAGSIGEIVVAGPTVTREYDGLPDATARAKIQGIAADVPGALYHRLGDAGYLDEAGRLWFCGRAIERVDEPGKPPLFTEQVEPHFNTHPQVRRTALIAAGSTSSLEPALVVEPRLASLARSDKACRAIAAALRAHGRGHPFAERIRWFYFHPRFPVDVRHNAKIHRLALRRWAQTARAYSGLDSDA